MVISSPTTGVPLKAVTTALIEALSLPPQLFLFGSRARGDARPDSDIDLLVLVQQASLSPAERQQILRALRAALLPLQLPVAVDLVVVGHQDAKRLAGSRWHVVARALREGKELYVAN